MTDEPEGAGSKPKDAVPSEATDIPHTRQHATTPEARPSASSLVTFPDDGPLARGLRIVDSVLGVIEQAVTFAILAAVVLVAATAALSEKVFDYKIGRWWHYIVRGGTFSLAMLGAVYTTQQQRHLAMDLISRRLSRRGRLVLGLVLKLFTIAIAIVLFRTGLHLRETANGADKEHLDLMLFSITDKEIVSTIALGATLIVVHSLLHAAIDVEYLVRKKLPPERERSAH